MVWTGFRPPCWPWLLHCCLSTGTTIVRKKLYGIVKLQNNLFLNFPNFLLANLQKEKVNFWTFFCERTRMKDFYTTLESTTKIALYTTMYCKKNILQSIITKRLTKISSQSCVKSFTEMVYVFTNYWSSMWINFVQYSQLYLGKIRQLLYKKRVAQHWWFDEIYVWLNIFHVPKHPSSCW